MPDWDNILPKIFADTRFHRTGRARYQINIDGTRAGVASRGERRTLKITHSTWRTLKSCSN